jgi:hypothetical protein
MFIRRVNEGEKLRCGINWLSNEKTLLGLKIKIPILPIFPKEYLNFDNENIYYGWQIKVIRFYIRIRRWKNFPKYLQKIIYRFSIYTENFGKQRFINSREIREDVM